MLLLLCLVLAESKFLGQVSTFDSNILRVYLFPHSHDDVGWVKTLREYYEMPKGVKQIITSYMNNLINDPTKHFSQVEIAFFQIWWNDQNEEMQAKVKRLVQNQQLEFLSGGWCMNDEATAYYEDIIDQMTLGHKFLLKNFNYIPSIGWQVDPFGHSNGQAILSSMMGFNAWFFGRIDDQDRKKREPLKELEFVIHPQTQCGVDYTILTHINYYGYYSSPQGFDFDASNPNRQSVTDNNLQQKVQQLVTYFNKQRNSYRGNIIAHTLGMDFQWSDSTSYFSQMDRVINEINKDSTQYKMNIIYATPKQYIEELQRQNVSYPTQREDFFPYQDYPNQYWSGYYTSRSSFKGYVKRIGRYFQQYKRLYSLFKINQLCDNICSYDVFQQLAEALGTSQHHDAITGTAKQYVNDDYIKMLDKAVENTDNQLSQMLNKLLSQNNENEHVQCNFNGSSICDAIFDPLLNNKSVLLTLIDTKINNNDQKEFIKFSIPQGILISILDENDQLIQGEILCIESNCTCFIQRKIDNSKLIHSFKIYRVYEQKYTKITHISHKNYEVNEETQIFDKFKLKYSFYIGSNSGAYVFRPDNNGAKQYGQIVKALKFEGSLVKQIYIERTNTKTWITTYDNEAFYIDSFINSIDVSDGRAKEIVLQIETNIQNNGIFYTDSNGLEQQKRQINHRDSWQMKVVEPISSNYFPVNSFLMIKNEYNHEAAALLNDRAQGGTSLKNGVLELMIQRRLNRDDNKGVFESLNEQEMINGKRVGMTQLISHTLIFYNAQQNPNVVRDYHYKQDLKSLLFFSQLSEQTNNKINYSQLQNIFQDFIIHEDKDNMSKLFIEPWIEQNQYLLRVHNMREVGLQKLKFPKGVHFVETTLTGNQDLSMWQQQQIKWNDNSNFNSKLYENDEIGPLQIRTWIVTI